VIRSILIKLKPLQFIRILGLATLIGMPFIGWLISLAFELDFDLGTWFFPDNFILQVFAGLVYGVLVAVLASWISSRDFMEKVRSKYARLLMGINFTWFDVFFISICAGVGEEILSRFALQSLTGIWIAAIIFVAIHGYLNYKDWPLSVYGSFMVLASAGFGLMAVKLGLLSAMIAHTVVDVYLLTLMKLDEKSQSKMYKSSTSEEIEHDSNSEY